ncbi:MAG TPA: hypothetical protein PKL83_04125 [bacterium]|nr:hypothetical protein [bacterium]
MNRKKLLFGIVLAAGLFILSLYASRMVQTPDGIFFPEDQPVPVPEADQPVSVPLTTLTEPEASPPANMPDLRILYPPEDQTIKDNYPTIIGILYQDQSTWIDYKYVEEYSPLDEKPHDYLRFYPSKLHGLSFRMDGYEMTAYGFAIFPTVICEVDPVTLAEHKYYYEMDEDACLLANAKRLPPVLFFLKPHFSLGNGDYTLDISAGDGQTKSYTIRIDRDLHSPDLILSKDDTHMLINNAPSCLSGYYYSENDLMLPLPDSPQDEVYYRIAFPHSKTSDRPQDRLVDIRILGETFDLILPNRLSFYGYPSREDYNSDAPYALFIPTNLLYYSDGTKADVWKFETDSQGNIIQVDQGYYSCEYFEYIPMDLTQQLYTEYRITRQTTSFSGCDG